MPEISPDLNLSLVNAETSVKANNLKRVLAIGVAAVGVAACLPNPTPMVGPEDGLRVGFVGDSLTYGAEYGPGLKEENDPDQHITDLLTDNGYRTSHSALIGAKTSSLDNLQAWPEQVDILQIFLGTNDMTRVIDPETNQSSSSVPLEEAIQNLEDYIDRVDPACVVLGGINQQEPSWGLDEYGPAYNDKLRALADDLNGVFIDWQAVLDEHPEYLGPDGVHLTYDGNNPGAAVYAGLFLEGANQCAEIIANNTDDEGSEPTSTTTSTTSLPQGTTSTPSTTTTVPSESPAATASTTIDPLI